MTVFNYFWFLQALNTCSSSYTNWSARMFWESSMQNLTYPCYNLIVTFRMGKVVLKKLKGILKSILLSSSHASDGARKAIFAVRNCRKRSWLLKNAAPFLGVENSSIQESLQYLHISCWEALVLQYDSKQIVGLGGQMISRFIRGTTGRPVAYWNWHDGVRWKV